MKFLLKGEQRGLNCVSRPLVPLYIPQSLNTLKMHAIVLEHWMRLKPYQI